KNDVVNVLRTDEIVAIPTPAEAHLIPSTCIKHFMYDDPLMDYIDCHREKVKNDIATHTMTVIPDTPRSPSSPASSSTNASGNVLPDAKKRKFTLMTTIMNDCYQKVITDIILKFPKEFYQGHYNTTVTQELIKRKVPIIYKARLVNHQLNYSCNVDLLVRYDFLNKLSPALKPPNNKEKQGYVVVNLSFKRIVLKVDGLHVCKFSNFGFVEGMLALANEALMLLQGFKYGTGGYVLSREGMMGRVDQHPAVLEKAKKAIEWRKKVEDDKGE